MKTDYSADCLRLFLLIVGLAASGVANAADQVTYCARVNSSSTTVWDPPLWWISAGGSDYGTSTSKSTAATMTRLGSYWHTANLLSPGEGFGVACSACTPGVDFVYEVEVTQPNSSVATDTIFGVCSTNCAVGGLSGGAGYPTNTTAFQAANSVNKWGFVCWLTNTLGVPNPEIEFHYVSGGAPSAKHYADCVRFTLVSTPGSPRPVRLIGISGGLLGYDGGSGTCFVLLKSADLGTAPNGWQRLATNWVTPSSFTIPTLTDGSAFYAIASE